MRAREHLDTSTTGTRSCLYPTPCGPLPVGMEPLLLIVALVLVIASPAAAQTPPHGDIRVPCDQCHTAQTWTTLRSPLGFDHARTEFPLRGQHTNVRCAGCHPQLRFAGAPTRCADCHEDLHRGELGVQCDRCHSPSTWLVPDMARRHSTTRFALVGAHGTAPCQSCHPNQQKHSYVGIPTDCYACHSTDYQAAKSPDHLAAGFSTDCSQCHGVNDVQWRGRFDHARTSFPLSGAHRAVPCTQCHTTPAFAGTPSFCYACHQQDFQNAANPRHANGFSTQCVTCHTTVAWRPASFNHASTRFALTGAHATASCNSCHAGGVYTGTPMTCGNAACHLTTYNATSKPIHATSGLSLACESCHTTTSWLPSTFNHTPFFPIAAGSKHSPGSWNVCADCHIVSSDYRQFSCINCHAHSPQSKVDDQHRGRANYSYTSPACYSCHPQGRS